MICLNCGETVYLATEFGDPIWVHKYTGDPVCTDMLDNELDTIAEPTFDESPFEAKD